MRRVLIVVLLVIGLIAAVIFIGTPRQAAAKPFRQPVESFACTNICDKSGYNTAWGVRRPTGEYLRSQQLGMGWILEIAYDPKDLARTVEAVNRAHDHGLQVMLRICSGNTCLFSNPQTYVQFLRSLASQIDGDVWPIMGPNEPELELWAGDATGVANYMNTVLDGIKGIPNLHPVSPSFNLTDAVTAYYFWQMEQAGARFADLDAFTGTSYAVAGNSAYYWYAYNQDHPETMRQKALRYGKPFIFVEFGTFDLDGHLDPTDPYRAVVVSALANDFAQMANDPTVAGVMFFNAYGANSALMYHIFYNNELAEMSAAPTCTGRAYRQAGVGLSTDQTVWQLAGEPTCRDIQVGCPFLTGVTCSPGTCIDDDHDGYYGQGGTCVRNDCDDHDPSRGLSCGDGSPDSPAAWGVLRTIQTDMDDGGPAWPVVQIGANGLPIIAYHNGTRTTRDLDVLACTSPGCQTALRQVALHENDAGNYLSMLIRPNGRPLITHLNQTDLSMEVFDCADAQCASGVSNVVDPWTGYWGFDTSMALRPDGFPAIAYYNSNFQDLGYIDCADANCLTAAPRLLDELNQVGNAPTVMIDAGGLPIIAYGRAGKMQLRLYRCADAGCTSGGYTILRSSALSLPTFAGLVRADGNPLIVYKDMFANRLMLLDCTAPDCSTADDRLLYQATGELQTARLILLPDGRPFVAFSELLSPGGYDLGLVACQDAHCQGVWLDKVTDGNSGEHPDVAIRPDGNPLVVFHNLDTHALMAYDVQLALIGPTPTPTHTPTATATATSTSTSTPTATSTPTNTATSTSTATSTAKGTPTNTPTATATATNTSTSTPTNTATSTATDTATAAARADDALVINFPPAGDTNRCGPLTVSYTAGSSLTHIVVALDGVPIDPASFDLLLVSAGAHTLTVDAIGSQGQPVHAEVTFTLRPGIAGVRCALAAFYARGDIDRSGIFESLDAKLAAAQDALARGQTDTAINQLNAFLNELEAQAGKHVAPEAGAILSGDVTSLIASPAP